jgi:TetR/AcrR family transcriptional regulator, transcriptional repressor for nem operon
MVQARGFGGASVRDIVEAAGVPQGSFTNHFASKKRFALKYSISILNTSAR